MNAVSNISLFLCNLWILKPGVLLVNGIVDNFIKMLTPPTPEDHDLSSNSIGIHDASFCRNNGHLPAEGEDKAEIIVANINGDIDFHEAWTNGFGD